jgi:hypothetical protein
VTVIALAVDWREIDNLAIGGGACECHVRPAPYRMTASAKNATIVATTAKMSAITNKWWNPW